MEVRAEIVRLQLAETFVISRESQDWADVVHVTLAHDGVVGRGEAAPIDRYGETAASAFAFVEQHGRLVGEDPFALEEVGARLARDPGEQAAKAALDAALHDLQGKLLGVPVSAAPRASPRGTADVVDGVARRSGRHGPAGRARLGAIPQVEAEARRRGRARRRAGARREQRDRPAAPGGRERVVVARRGGRCVPQLAELGVEYVEQPLPAGRPRRRRAPPASPVPIYVDEDCHTLADVAACAEIAHGITIKLAKSGGIREAIRMAHAARALGLGVMLGCMIESGLGIAAGCAVAPLCDHVDLDGNLLLAHDPAPGPEFRDGVQLASEGVGLGCG